MEPWGPRAGPLGVPGGQGGGPWGPKPAIGGLFDLVYIYILDVKMELKLHLYSITWVTSVLKPNEPGSATWNLDFGTWNLERGC